MILLNCTNITNLNSIINIDDLQNEALEIRFRNKSLENPYLLIHIGDLLESMMLNVEDNNDSLIVVHNMNDAIINMENIENDIERLNIRRPLLNVLRGYSEANHDIVVLKDGNEINSFFTDLLEFKTTVMFNDTFKLNGFITERI